MLSEHINYWCRISVSNWLFLMGSKYLQPGIKGSSKSNKLVAITGGLYQPGYHPLSDLWPNKIPYGIMFDLISRRNISVKIGLFFQEIVFITEFPGSNFLLPTFLTGGKWDFQVANLLLSNPENDQILTKWICSLIWTLFVHTRSVVALSSECLGRKTLMWHRDFCHLLNASLVVSPVLKS